MSLRTLTLTFPEEPVTFAGGKFSVRGLALSDITILVAFHKDRLGELFEQFAVPGADSKLELTPESGVPFALAFIQMAPTIAAHIIALADVREEGEDPDILTALKLPLDVQLDALEKILKLTFQMEGGPKKVLEMVMRAVVATMKFTTGLKT